MEQDFDLPRGILLAVASRESTMSNVVGDGGHGRGLFQIDDRYHLDWLTKHGAGKPGTVPPVKDAARYAARILVSHRNRAKKEGRNHPWKFALCAYNRGYTGAANGVRDGGTCDYYTANGDYSVDVQKRADVFRSILDTVPLYDGVRRPKVQLDTRHLVASYGHHKPIRIILHSTESGDIPGVSEMYNIASYWSRIGLGAHLTVDSEGNTAHNVDFDELAFHVARRNTGSIGIEMVGYAGFSRSKWLSRMPQLEKAAKWLAYLSFVYDIPLVHDPERGVSTHHDQTKYANIVGGHYDPGPGFPFDKVISMAREFKKYGW